MLSSRRIIQISICMATTIVIAITALITTHADANLYEDNRSTLPSGNSVNSITTETTDETDVYGIKKAAVEKKTRKATKKEVVAYKKIYETPDGYISNYEKNISQDLNQNMSKNAGETIKIKSSGSRQYYGVYIGDVGDKTTEYDDTTTYERVDTNMTQAQFIKKIGSIAVEYYDEYEYLPSVTIAQAIIESGWGKSRLAREAYNYFGIKWTKGCGHDYVTMATKEQLSNGNYVKIYARFRKYKTLSDGIKDRFEFLSNNKRYSNLKGVTNYKEFCYLLKKDGYATSQTYAQKLIKCIEQYGLEKYDKKVI